MSAPYLLGLDVGGTSVRCLVADVTGRHVGSGRAEGANPNVVGMPIALQRIASAATEALGGLDRARVGAAVMGAAGFASGCYAGYDGPSDLDARVMAMWRALGLDAPLRVVADALVGFCAGSDARVGTVVMSGTGAGAVEVRDLRTRLVSDAAGWLLGDHGSGQWVGREAVRHAVRPQLTPPQDPLSVGVREVLLGRPDGTRSELVHAVYAASPLVLSTLAPTVARLAGQGDPDATSILRAAAAELLVSTAAVRTAGDETPVVLTGGMFDADVLRADVEARLRAAWPGAPVLRSGRGAGGAVWLAAHDLGSRDGWDPGRLTPALHLALTA